MIDRPRLQAALVRRFEVPVTVIVAPAGSGKSSLIELAVADNRLDPRGRDVVVSLRPRDAERSAFLAAVGRALGLADGVAADPDLVHQAIYDAVWAAAPDDLVVWVDDAHVLEEDAVAGLDSLVQELPGNGHLAVSSRRPLDLGLARLRAQGRLLELDQHDLRLDDDEVTRLAESLGRAPGTAADGADLPRHAATAALLATTGGPSASIAFLQEEIIAGLGSERLERLRRLVALDRIDVGLARTLTDDELLDLDALVRGLPLVAEEGSAVRMHDLLRDALVDGMPAGELRKVRSLTGDALAERHDYVGAIDAHLAAGDEVSAREAARRYVRRPTITQTTTETRGVLRRVMSLDGETPLVAALRATALQSSSVWSDEIDAWRTTRDLAAGVDDEIEALALHRLAQSRFLDVDPWEEIDDEIVDAYDRLEQLADHVDLAAAATAHVASQSAQRFADVDAALDALEGYERFEAPDNLLMRWQRLTDLGFVERVGEYLGADDFPDIPSGAELFLGYAMWLRGEGAPELAEAAVSAMIAALGERGPRVSLASAVGTGVPIALACGDIEVAAERVARLRELDRFELPRNIRCFVAVAEGLLAAVLESDDTGAQRFASFGRFVEICGWPMRPHLLALPFLYLARPDSRAALDRMRTGEAITQALDAGRALVALREHGDPAPASLLAWSDPRVLRNHVLPHHLAELACAAHAAGHATAGEVLAAVPHLERQLRRVADQGAEVAASRAVELLGRLPRRAPATIRLDVLGPPALRRDGSTDHTIAQRGRAAELLTLLATHGETTRDDVIDAIWGGYETEDKASANLRATLTQLHRLLEPNRERGVDPYYLRASGTALSLHGVTTDVEEFEHLTSLARDADAAGTPRVALGHYLEAMRRYRGDLLSGHDASWILLDRVRLRSLASGASCRIAELLAARGDTEDAATWARRALSHEPLSDRAGAAFVKALLANDDRRNAAAALDDLLRARRDAGVEPSPALLRLAEQLPSSR